MTQIAPYGSWQSPIGAELLVAASVRLSEPQICSDYYYWVEGRPQQKGRSVIVRKPIAGGPAEDLIAAPYSARSSCHEYGGASYCVAPGQVFFVNAADQRIYQVCAGEPRPISPEGEFRYGDLHYDPGHQRLLAVREDHRAKNRGEASEERNELVAVYPDGRVTVLASGADFYSNPSLSPDGKQLSWLCWRHPHMPWDASSCYIAELDAQGLPQNSRCIAGFDLHGTEESVFQPQFGPDGQLYFVSDRSDWWNLYRFNPNTQISESLCPMAAEFATPQWVFGMSCYGFLNDDTLLCCYTREGRWQLAELELTSGQLKHIDSPYDDISMIVCAAGRALLFAANSEVASSLCQYQQGQLKALRHSSEQTIEPAYIARPQALSFSSGEELAHGFYYAPCNPDYSAPAGELPPLIVLCHGGPTGATETALNIKIQFWTSRGFAVLDVNYRGSTGYGRPYRDSLKRQWGIKDVQDVCAGAQYLVDQGLADPARLAIKGGSAGGYTVLAALAFENTFAAGASHYGIGDLETLARDTHKFESRYLDSMIGPYPEDKALYQARSPIHSVEQLNCPVIFFQGLDDKVVPPNQAETMVAALKDKGLPVAYVPFAGEGHGFRGAEAIVTALEGELYFYSRIFGFAAPAVAAVTIANMENH
ncbi:MAG: S9 family peptidase [Cellvibrionaceae bacterium]|nr:S9 family peptidase [Cellvibrionaceae bacterium]